MDLDTMTGYELVAGLMRGNRAEQKLGYEAEAAARVAADRTGEDYDTLVAYGKGFAQGMSEDGSRAYMAE